MQLLFAIICELIKVLENVLEKRMCITGMHEFTTFLYVYVCYLFIYVM
jgi:hypothetical protein